MTYTVPAERLGRGPILAISLVGTLAWLTMTLLPYEVASLADQYGAGMIGAGWIVAAELLAVAASAAWFGRTIDTRDKRRLAMLGVAVALLASIGSIYAADISALVGFRLVFGLGCGMLAAATNALPTLDSDPERVFASMQVAVGVIFGVATYAAGYASMHVDRDYVFLIHIAFILLFGGATLALPRGVQSAVSTAQNNLAGALTGPVLACIAAAGLTWAALSAVWAFAEQAGAVAGVAPASLGLWFAVSGFMTPLGGLAAAGIGERQGYRRPLVAGFAVLIGVCLAMYVVRSPSAYIAGLLLMNFPITFVMSYLMALLAGLDHSGRGPSVGGAAINFGGAAGPALGAMALSTRDLSIVGFIGAAILLAALALSASSASRLSASNN